MFAYARDVDDSIVLAAGIPVDWFEGDGVAIRGLHTPQGELGYSLRRDGDALVLEVAGGIDVPAGGLVLPWPYAGEPGSATIDGNPAQWQDGELRIRAAPARVEIEMRSEEHTSELQSLMRISYAVFCLKKKKKKDDNRGPLQRLRI